MRHSWPSSRRGEAESCPYDHEGCVEHIPIPFGNTNCPCGKLNPIYSTDALRIHERFSHDGTNGEAFGLVSEVWGKVLLVHLLRCFERRGAIGSSWPPSVCSRRARSASLDRLHGSARQ